MPQLIRPGEVKTVVKDGELHVSISLELNINLNGDVQVAAQAEKLELKQKPKDEEQTMWEIPDFGSSGKIDFGK